MKPTDIRGQSVREEEGWVGLRGIQGNINSIQSDRNKYMEEMKIMKENGKWLKDDKDTVHHSPLSNRIILFFDKLCRLKKDVPFHFLL